MDATFAQLGILGLPARIHQLARAMIYAVVADQQSIRIPLLARTAVRSIDAKIPVVLLSQAEPNVWVKKARLAGIELSSYLRSGQLRIFRHNPESTKQVFQGGAQQIIAELNAANLELGSLVIFDQADSAFQLADPRFAVEACEVFQSWAEENNLTVLAAFVPSSRAPRDYVTLRAISENMAGYAVLRNGPENAQLEFRHWFGPEGPNPRSSFGLHFDDAGVLSAWSAGRGANAALDAIMEVEIATARAIDDFVSTAHSWKSVATYADALAAVREGPAGTLLLHFSFPSEFRLLCQTVASIRSVGRPQWRVVIREKGSRLRIPHIVTLLRLGASLVIPESTDTTSARLIAEAFRGTLFTRGVEARVDTVIDDMQGLEARTIQTPSEFRKAAERLMASGSEFEIPHTLVRLGLDQIDGGRISSILARRGARDMICTEHDNSLWVFLFGCPVEQAEPVLSRLLGRNFERLFEGWFRVGRNRDILAALALLEPPLMVEKRSSNVIELPLKRIA
jgi:Cellulose biosynthesis GIL